MFTPTSLGSANYAIKDEYLNDIKAILFVRDACSLNRNLRVELPMDTLLKKTARVLADGKPKRNWLIAPTTCH